MPALIAITGTRAGVGEAGGRKRFAGVAGRRQDLGSYGPPGTLEGNTAHEHNQMGLDVVSEIHTGRLKRLICVHTAVA